jgi:hypothetical protein
MIGASRKRKAPTDLRDDVPSPSSSTKKTRIMCGKGGNGRVWVDARNPTVVIKADEVAAEAYVRNNQPDAVVSSSTTTATLTEGMLPSSSFLVEMAIARRLGLPLHGLRWHWIGKHAKSPHLHLVWSRYKPMARQPMATTPASATLEELEWLRDVTVDILVQLAHAHKQEVVHGDLSPDNLLEDQRRVKVIDWGAAYLVHAPRVGLGKPAYRAPELWNPDEGLVRAASKPPVDIWALGLIILQWIVGKSPLLNLHLLDAATARKSMQLLLTDQPKWLSRLVPDALKRRAPSLWDWLTLALHGDPDRRPTAHQLLAHPFCARAQNATIPTSPTTTTATTATAPLPPPPSRMLVLPPSVSKWMSSTCTAMDLSMATLDNAKRLVLAFAQYFCRDADEEVMIYDDPETALVATAALVISDLLFSAIPNESRWHLSFCKPVWLAEERRQQGQELTAAMEAAERYTSMPNLERCIRRIISGLDGYLIHI